MSNIAVYNFPDHTNGDTFTGVQFEVLVNASPLILTGATIKMQIRESYSSSSKTEFSTTNGALEITDAIAGKFIFKNQIVRVVPRKYVYDIQIALPSGELYTYIKGEWVIHPDVTRE